MADRTWRVVVAPDSFKGSCAAAEVAAALASGVRSVLGGRVEIVECPLADGGEGTLDAVAAAMGLRLDAVATCDALGRPREGRVGISPDARWAVVEAAEANGLPHVADTTSRPLLAHSLGVGMLLREVLDAGVSEVLLGIGGSASSDGGTGVLSALGARFLDDRGAEVPLGAQGLASIASVDLSGLHPQAKELRLLVAVDVDNPLIGDSGAAAVFGPQKGADPHDITVIEAGLTQLGRVLEGATGVAVTEAPGHGAAGGLPACLVSLLGAELVPGSELVRQAVGFHEVCEGADLVITGEGRFDQQSLRGKVIDGVVAAVDGRCPVVVVAGSVALSPSEVRESGVTAALSIATGPSTLAEMISATPNLLHAAASHVAALFTSAGDSMDLTPPSREIR